MDSKTHSASRQAIPCRCSNIPRDFEKQRSRRTLKPDDPLEERDRQREQFPIRSFSEGAKREFVEKGKRALLHAEWLKSKNNHFYVTLQIAKAANEFQRNNKQEAARQKPVLRAIADEINKEYRHLSDKLVTDAYNEDYFDYRPFINSPADDPEEYVEVAGPRPRNSWNWSERRTDWKKGEPWWVTKKKRKDLVWTEVHDATEEYQLPYY